MSEHEGTERELQQLADRQRLLREEQERHDLFWQVYGQGEQVNKATGDERYGGRLPGGYEPFDQEAE